LVPNTGALAPSAGRVREGVAPFICWADAKYCILVTTLSRPMGSLGRVYPIKQQAYVKG